MRNNASIVNLEVSSKCVDATVTITDEEGISYQDSTDSGNSSRLRIILIAMIGVLLIGTCAVYMKKRKESQEE